MTPIQQKENLLTSGRTVIDDPYSASGIPCWSKCEALGCDTRCPGVRCEDHDLTTSGVGTGIDLDDVQTCPDTSIVEDLVDGETEHTSLLHRVDDLRIVRLDDAIGNEYRIEERSAGRWETRTELTRVETLLVAGMVNKWGDE